LPADAGLQPETDSQTSVVTSEPISSGRDVGGGDRLLSGLGRTRGVPIALAQGLSTGHFDVADVKLLRTCSEPDLSQFTRPAAVAGTGSSENVRSCVSTSDETAAEDMDVLEQVIAYNFVALYYCMLPSACDDRTEIILSAEEFSDETSVPHNWFLAVLCAVLAR
jgi:hypothetical protein